MIEITGYDVVNGGRTRAKKFRSRFVSNIEALERERKKIQRRQERIHGEPCEIFFRYQELNINDNE